MNIVIIHNNINNINISCGNKDNRGRRYKADNIITDEEVMDLARREYGTNRLPCEGIKIQCSSMQYFEKSCIYKYQVNHFYSPGFRVIKKLSFLCMIVVVGTRWIRR